MNVNQEMEKRPILPPGWRWVKLGEICNKIDYGYTTSARNIVGLPKFLRITDIQNGRVDWNSVPECEINDTDLELYLLADGDIVFARTGATTGKSYLVRTPPRSVFGSYLIRLRNKPKIVDSAFLFLYFQSEDYWRQILAGARGGAQAGFNATMLRSLFVPLPPLTEQRRIVTVLNEQMAAIEKAQAAAEAQLEAAKALQFSITKSTLINDKTTPIMLRDCLIEVTEGVGNTWGEYKALGATRNGIALAKERLGKYPERYKYVSEGTIFYNPMRILLGSIAYVDIKDDEGITSPDYVVFKTKTGILHHRWFYHWLRSPLGDELIRSLSRGAVRERMLFNRLCKGLIRVC